MQQAQAQAGSSSSSSSGGGGGGGVEMNPEAVAVAVAVEEGGEERKETQPQSQEGIEDIEAFLSSFPAPSGSSGPSIFGE